MTPVSSFVTEMDVRFGDLDPMGHVNHAAYAGYLEQARAKYYDAVIGTAMEDQDVVVAHLEIDYARAIGFRDAPEVHLDVASIGDSSIRMAYDVYADDELAATAETVQVIVDPETGESRPVPDEILEAIVEYHGLDH